MKSVNILLFMFTIYGVWLILGGERRYITGNPVANFEYLKRICMSFLPMFVFYYFTLFAKLTEKRLRAYSLLFFVVTCFSFVNNYNNQLQRALVSGSSQEEFTNNVGYEFVALLPLLYAWRKHVFIQYLFLFALSCFVFMAMKRGAILIHCICVVVFVYEMHKVLKGRRRLRMIFLLMLLLAIGLYYLFSFYDSSIYFQKRMDATLNGNTSGRDELFQALLGEWLSFDFFALLFGKGADATIDIAGNYAHNDWLELLINQGLLGVMLYVCYFIGLYAEVRKAQKRVASLSIPLLLLFIILFISSLFSMSYSSISIYLSVGGGYYLCRNNIGSIREKLMEA